MTSFSETIWADALLDRLEGYLAARAVYSQDAIWTYLGDGADLLDHPPREAFVVLSLSALAPHRPVFDGGGRVAPQFDATVAAVQYQRLLLDREAASARLMKDRSRGLIQTVRRLVAALQLWDAADAATASPLAEPGRLAGPIRFNAKRTPPGWASVQSEWELKFRSDIPLTVA